jgi:LacI family transcriptional regulator
MSSDGRRSTIDDVAALAGVGRTTVSRVLNNGPNVRPEVRDRVERAITALEYKVNVQARNLAGRSTRQIALIHASDLDTEPNSYYHSGLELGALRACAERGLQLVTHTVNQTSPVAERRILDLIDEGRCDGVILTPPFSDRVDLIRQIIERKCPIVCVAASLAVRELATSVGIDEKGAGLEVTRYLIDQGHRTFGYVRGPSGHQSAEGRFDGFLEAIEGAGLGACDVVIERGNFTFHSGIECARRIMERADRPTALVCANDDMAAGALLAIHKLGLEIPRDVSVVGFDDTPVSEIVWPPLTTVHQPLKLIGQRAVDLIVDPLSGKRRPTHEVVPFSLIARESTSPPRSDGLRAVNQAGNERPLPLDQNVDGSATPART